MSKKCPLALKRYFYANGKEKYDIMDFFTTNVIQYTSNNRKFDFSVKPEFIYGLHQDLVTKGGSMYAYWNGTMWSRDLNNLIGDIDSTLKIEARKISDENPGKSIDINLISKHSTGLMIDFLQFCKAQQPKDVRFNQRIIFSDEVMERDMYATAQLDYFPKEGSTENFHTLFEKLYAPSEFDKLRWAIGMILSGQTHKVQKMLFLYGEKGSGKGSFISILKRLTQGYYGTFNLGLLTSADQFATGGLEEKPVLIDDDSDASRVFNDTHLLKLTAHETVIVNNKYQTTYPIEFQGMLIAASNKTIKIRDVDAGLVRRVIEVRPTSERWSPAEYRQLMNSIKFEIPAIAYECIKFVEEVGVDYYYDYVPLEMMEDTDMVFQFMRNHILDLGDKVTLNRAAAMYVEYIEDLGWDSKGAKKKMKDALHRYYHKYHDRIQIDGVRQRNVYEGIRWDKIFPDGAPQGVTENFILRTLDLREIPSLLDGVMKDYPAQLTKEDGTPLYKWDDVTTTVKDIDTHELHFVRLPLNHIVLDFDIKDKNGEKDLQANVDAAMEYPPTYTEVSKSGKGIHLHYYYDGNVNDLSRNISSDIEVKVFNGKASLRRRLSLCNDLPMATLAFGLPEKEKKETNKMYEDVKDIVYTEKTLRSFIFRELGMIEGKNPTHEHTAPTISWISENIWKAHDAGVKYDIHDLKHDIFMRALRSNNQKPQCLKIVSKIPWSTLRDDDGVTEMELTSNTRIIPKEELVFFDIEVYPNLFIVVWKKWHDDEYVRWINPTPEQIEYLCSFPLVGFNNRRYDNHILYARLLGGDNFDLFKQSGRIINEKNAKTGMYAAAYELSYADIYEYSQKKQSLKKWEVELGINHVEMQIPWDQPVPEHLWDTVMEYCVNDVMATEVLFDHLYLDYRAREILATIAQGSMNATNNQLTAKFIFGDDPRPQDKFNYVDLSVTFPGYKFEWGKSTYRGVETGEGGYVYAKPGVYQNVGLMDVESMHPNSLVNMNYFGPYTQRYADLLKVRVLLKHGKIDDVKKMFNGALAPFLNEDGDIGPLVSALKIVINSVYGMTSASFDNKFKHPKNIDNIVAKRGALFMVDLRFYLEDIGYNVVHIKTDSVKVADITDECVQLIHEFGARPEYNYKFDYEDKYSRLALINNAVYICQSSMKKPGKWSATGAEFRDPYIFKRVWTKEELTAKDFFLTKQSKGHIYLGTEFVGKVGSIYASKSGEEALWTTDEENFKYLTGTKGYRFKQSEDFVFTDIDMDYYDAAAIKGLKKIMKVGDINLIVDDMPKDYIEALGLSVIPQELHSA